MASPTGRAFNFRPGSKVSAGEDYATDSLFWESLATITHLLKLINIVVAFMEEDSVPISFLFLSFNFVVKKL